MGTILPSVDAPVFLANDADVAAVGEADIVAGKSYTDVVFITISTDAR